MIHAHSLASKVAPEEPAVSVGASEFEVRSFSSPKSFFQNQVDYGKDYNLGMGARSSNWRTRPLEMSAFPESSMFHEMGEMSGFKELGALPQTSTELTFPTPDGSTFRTLDQSTLEGSTTKRPIKISAISGHPFRRLAYKQKLTIFSTCYTRSTKHSGWKSNQRNQRRSWI